MRLRKNRVAVISSKAALVDFFRLEAEFCGCSVQTFAEPPASVFDFDRVILDATAGCCVSENPEARLAVVLSGEKEKSSVPTGEIWEWPVSVETVHEFLEGSLLTSEPSKPREEGNTIYVLSAERRMLLYRNRTIELPPHAWRVITCLGENAGSVVTREKLAALLGEEKGNMTDVYVHHLRKQLEEPHGVRMIATVRGVGYRLDARWLDTEQK